MHVISACFPVPTRLYIYCQVQTSKIAPRTLLRPTTQWYKHCGGIFSQVNKMFLFCSYLSTKVFFRLFIFRLSILCTPGFFLHCLPFLVPSPFASIYASVLYLILPITCQPPSSPHSNTLSDSNYYLPQPLSHLFIPAIFPVQSWSLYQASTRNVDHSFFLHRCRSCHWVPSSVCILCWIQVITITWPNIIESAIKNWSFCPLITVSFPFMLAIPQSFKSSSLSTHAWYIHMCTHWMG